MSATECCSCGSGCGCCASPQKEVRIDFLYLDLNTCDRCSGTERALDEAVSNVRPALSAAGYDVTVRKTLIDTRNTAIEWGLQSSPTIRVNGHDIAPVQETQCKCCGDICGDDVDCRVWTYQGQEYTAPPKALIAEAILTYFSAPAVEPTPCALADNLERFFQGINR